MEENFKNLRLAEAISHIVQTAIRYEVEHKDIHSDTVVTKVKLSKDRQYAKIFILPSSNDKTTNEKEISAFNKISGFFRKKIAESIRVRAVPEISFIIDSGFRKGEEVLDLLKKI